MVTFLLHVLYLLLPAYAANMAPVIVHRLNFLPQLAHPIDNGEKLWDEPVFGATKTWRGFVVGISTAMIVAIIQYFLWQFNVMRMHTPIDFRSIDPVMFGFLGGLGVLGGDLIKSFFKRRFKIASSQPWPVFDQLDFIIGYIAFTLPLVPWTGAVILTALVITLILHPLTNMAAYILKIKNIWW